MTKISAAHPLCPKQSHAQSVQGVMRMAKSVKGGGKNRNSWCTQSISTESCLHSSFHCPSTLEYTCPNYLSSCLWDSSAQKCAESSKHGRGNILGTTRSGSDPV